ncbi:flagellar hook-associated protein 1 FlgK [Desulfobotulus alkaliphilus]|uniref:Flagellar hook-associated protein 1 n=1 Tax=Desulfobotulus alkaliphilus TaxID=622671 RepID=A0A562RTE6_9BACT|nr:flagellar hook-associated protein FlgK [Desulfobotulus alkaliphilus]TWI72385.1 flagellar hook-associated protein 1 FlgK [Desulfobotulus alkaliphilus]
MAGINSTMNIARQGLAAQQLGLNVTGHNIANVNNPDFSRQSVPQAANAPLAQSGHLIGNGVMSQQIRQTADQLLEDRITSQKSAFSASEAFMNYMKVLANMFNENSETSMSHLMPDFWDSWNTLANNPAGAAERMNVYENGAKLVDRFNTMDADFFRIEQDLNKDIQAGIAEVNRLTREISKLNQAIMGQEVNNRTSNDNRDMRNQMVKELANYIDIKSFEDSHGAITVNTAGGFPLVSRDSSYGLIFESGKVKWESSTGYVDITDRIQGGSLGGWLEMRDVELPRYRQEMDALARETIWNVNRIHSMGAGSAYMTEPLQGSYRPEAGNWLATLPYGDRIDYSKDFGMWVENKGTIPSSYTQTVVDMGISTAEVQNWSGTGRPESTYEFEVLRSGSTGESLWIADGQHLGTVQSASTLDAALNQAIGRQTLKVKDGQGNIHTLEVGRGEGMVYPSADAIAEALNGINGLNAHAWPHEISLDITELFPGAGDMQEDDEIMFSFASGNTVEEIRFRVGADDAATMLNFQTALDAVLDKNSDLSVVYGGSGAIIRSEKGVNLGIADFKVVDNASITIDGFLPDTGPDGSAASFSLAGVDIAFQLVADPAESARNLVAALNRESAALKEQGISWELAGTGVNIRGSGGSSLDIRDLQTHGGNDDGGFTVNGAAGTLVDGAAGGSQPLTGSGGAGLSEVTIAPDEQATGTLAVDAAVLGAGGDRSAVKTSTFTVFTGPGMEISSDAQPGQGSLFNSRAEHPVPSGRSVLTLGGYGGFENFNANDTITFTVDGMDVIYTVPDPAPLSAEAFAEGLYQALQTSGLDPGLYRTVHTGSSVSIVRNDGEAIRIEEFDDTTTGNASLRVVTGSGFGLEGPASRILSNASPVVESDVFGAGAAIAWREYDVNGDYTGLSGLIAIEESGPHALDGTDLSFHLSPGTLVAGNTFSMNTSETGSPAPLEISISGRAGSINDSYIFSVKPPGGALGEETVTLIWESRYGHGEVEVKVDERTRPPIYVEVDGMRLGFESGTLFKDDIFVIQTDAGGKGSLMQAADWRWTTDSFAAQFNRQSEGISARVGQDGSLSFTSRPATFEISDMGCSGVNGFCDVNTRMRVLDATALEEKIEDFRIYREADGTWRLEDPRGLAVIVPDPDDPKAAGKNFDSGFGIDMNGNGLADIQLAFDEPVTGSGFVEFDIVKRNPEHYGFAFSGEEAHNSGLAAALGVNTFFTGTDAKSIRMNESLAELQNIAAGMIDFQTGEIRGGDNSTALALADLQNKSIRFEEWQFSRNGKAVSAGADASLEGYYHMMVSSMGLRYQSETRALNFHGVMLSNLGQQRDTLSAVSLDEEMVNLIKYQQAYTAAAKLITVSDEMLSTLVNMR